MARVQRLGGQSCTYFQRDRCTRTRGVEAGAAARCALLERRRKVGADTLDRLQRVKRLADPEDREVARRHLIQKNLDRITRIECEKYVPVSGNGPLCAHQHLVYCLLLLPECKGRCEYFLLSRKFREGEEDGEVPA